MTSSGGGILFVEGKDDLFTIAGLLRRHGVNMDKGKRPIEILVARDPLTGAEGVVPLLSIMTDAVKNASDRPIGFVLDVDVKVIDRWNGVRHRLAAAGLTPPTACPSDGYLGQLPNYPNQVGVWMMPDCVSDHGQLEHLLTTLVPVTDQLWPHAEQSTTTAKQIGATFREVDRNKAVIHCWLAWQEDPGLPFGSAINAKFFGHDSPEALAFLRWLKRLFALTPPTSV